MRFDSAWGYKNRSHQCDLFLFIPRHFVTAPWGHAVTPFGRSGRPFGILRAKYQDQPRIQVVKYPEPEDIPSEKHLSVRESRSFPGWNAQIGRSVRRNGGFPGRKSQFAMTCPGKQTFPRMTMGLGTPEQAMASQLLKSSCVSYTQRARAACFVPVIRKTENVEPVYVCQRGCLIIL